MFILVFLLIVFTTIAGFSQDISISATLDKNVVSLNEQLSLEISITGAVGSISRPKLPSMPAFSVYSSGQSQNITFVNGKLSSTTVFTYVLVPKKTGKFTIDSITFSYKGKIYNTPPLEVEVVKGHIAPMPGPSPVEEEHSSKKAEEKIFTTLFVDKKEAYVNEQITLTFKFYRSINIIGSPQYTPPETIGFWVEDLPPQKNYYTIIDGRKFLVTEIKTALFATKPGRLTIGSAYLKCTVEDFDNNFFNDDFFRDFFPRGKVMTLSTKPIEVNILTLPEKGKPPFFSGAVGRFDVSTSVDNKEPHLGQPVILKAKICGEGNINSISSPEFPELEGFQKYAPVATSDISKDNYLVQGCRTFQMLVVPRKKGKIELGVVKFAYFDPQKKKYKILNSDLSSLNVLPTLKEKQPEVPPVPEGELEVVHKDILFIKSPPSRLIDEGRMLYNSLPFIIGQILPLLLLLGFMVYRHQTEKESRDPLKVAQRRAYRVFKRSWRSLKSKNIEDKKEFYGALSRIVLEYLEKRFACNMARMTVEEILEILNTEGIKPQDIESLQEIFQRCDLARFSTTDIDLSYQKEDLTRVKHIIECIEGLKTKR